MNEKNQQIKPPSGFITFITIILTQTFIGFIMWTLWQIIHIQSGLIPSVSLITAIAAWFLTFLVLSIPNLFVNTIMIEYKKALEKKL